MLAHIQLPNNNKNESAKAIYVTDLFKCTRYYAASMLPLTPYLARYPVFLAVELGEQRSPFKQRPVESVPILYFPMLTKHNGTIALFDMDGTLTPSRRPASVDMLMLLKRLRKSISVGVVSGSNEEKIREQLVGIYPSLSVLEAYSLDTKKGNRDALDVRDPLYEFVDYMFAENGTVARKGGTPLCSDATLLGFLGERQLQGLINFCLAYMARLELPTKRGTFVEYRSGVLNICPPGRSSTQEERDRFEKFDTEKGIRKAFVEVLRDKFGGFGMDFAIGGQISIDCFPQGWDKRYCLKHLVNTYDRIVFFGDRTEQGGNDHQIFSDPRVEGYSVSGPEETIELVNRLLLPN